MKRRFIWLVLPPLLFASIWGVKWRTEHPTPTQEDLETRAFLSQSSNGECTHYSPSRPPNTGMYYTVSLSKSDLNLLVENFFLSRTPDGVRPVNPGEKGVINIHFIHAKREAMGSLDSYFHIGVDEGRAEFLPVNGVTSLRKLQMLHPITVKRWMDFLLTHPRIGPELRKRMEP